MNTNTASSLPLVLLPGTVCNATLWSDVLPFNRRKKCVHIDKLEETLLMTLEYLREYRTYFHISQSYGLSEGYTYKLIKWVEDTLI
jgi:hypothetical protein